MPILRGFIGLFFSTNCLGCGLKTPFLGLCDACLTRLTPRQGPRCPTCDIHLRGRNPGYKCGECVRSPPHFESVLGIFDYEGPAGRAMAFGKYHRCPEAVDWVARQVIRHCPKSLKEDPPDAVVAVPLTWRRARRRGFRPPQIIAHRVARALDRPLLSRSLVRSRETREQAGLNLKDRQHNIRKAFSVEGPLPENVLIVDDVFTTGSTVREVSRTLYKGGADRIRVLTACYVGNKDSVPTPIETVSVSVRR